MADRTLIIELHIEIYCNNPIKEKAEWVILLPLSQIALALQPRPWLVLAFAFEPAEMLPARRFYSIHSYKYWIPLVATRC